MITLGDWAIFALFAIWGIGSFIRAWARQKRYREYQRDLWLLAGAIEAGLMAFAFIGSALRSSPHPIWSFEGLRDWIIIAWLVAFIPFGAGIFLDWYSLARMDVERSKE